MRSTGLYKRQRSDLYHTGLSATIGLSSVVEPTETTSRLIADVQLDDGFPLEPGVAGFDRVLTGVAAPKTAI